jgi:hypothetical protein
MKKLMTAVALATVITSPLFATPADAVTAGLLAATAATAMITAVRFGVSSSSSAGQPALSRPASEPATVTR